jgi:predicted membrane-bound mannosyltransferase
MLRRLSLDWRPRRLHWRPTRPDPVTLVVLAIVGVGLITRVVDLGVRAMHHDESLHATFSWYFAGPSSSSATAR